MFDQEAFKTFQQMAKVNNLCCYGAMGWSAVCDSGISPTYSLFVPSESSSLIMFCPPVFRELH